MNRDNGHGDECCDCNGFGHDIDHNDDVDVAGDNDDDDNGDEMARVLMMRIRTMMVIMIWH